MKDHVYNHLARTLIGYGVECVFGMRVYPEMDLSRLRHINMHHETSGALMAIGYARVSGKPGVLTLNRAGTPNVIMGLAEAFNSSVPIIALQDGLNISLQGKNALYEHDQLGMVRPVAKWIGDVVELSTAPFELRKAFRMATTGRPGPVVLNIRGVGSVFADSQWVEAEVSVEPEYARFPAHRLAPDPDAVERAADLLSTAGRPCIIAGGGVNLSRAWAELRALAELGGFPVATTVVGKGAFPENHPLSAGPTARSLGGLGRGRVAKAVIKASDAVLLVGSRTDELATSGWRIPDPKSDIVHLDVDPREIGRNYDTAVGIVADAKLGLEALRKALVGRGYAPKHDRAPEIAELLGAWWRDNETAANSGATPIHPARLMREIREVMDGETILVPDASTAYIWAASHTFAGAGTTFIAPRGTGAIGTGLPLAMGAKLAAPERKVICLEGDGGLLCGILPELETAARYGIGVVVVVLNNGTLQLERNHIKSYPNAGEFDLLPGINFANIARELKCDGVRVERPDEIRPAFQRALESGKPTLIDVVLDPNEGFPG